MTRALLGRTPGRCWSSTTESAASAPARRAGSGGPGCGQPGCPRPGRLRASQGDDAAALVLADAPGHAGAGQVSQRVDAAGVEPVQPLVDRLGVAAQPLGELGDAGAVPAAGDDA